MDGISPRAGRARGLLQTALRRPPSYWAASYLWVLVGSAIVYSLLPARNFIDSNLRLEPDTYRDRRTLSFALGKVFSEVSRPSHWRGAHGRFRLGPGLLVTPEGKPPGAPPGLIAIQLFGVSYGPPEPPLGFEGPQDFRTWFTINVLEGEPQLDEEGDTIGTTFIAQPTGPDGVGPPAGLYGEAPLSSLLPLRAEPGINGDHPAELLQLHGEAARKLQEFGEA